jgi:hypothetical protein
MTTGTDSCDIREIWMISGGDNAARKSGTAISRRGTNPYHWSTSGLSALEQQLSAADRMVSSIFVNLVEAERVASDDPTGRYAQNLHRHTDVV